MVNAEQLVIRDMMRDEFKKSLYSLCKYGLGYKDINYRTHGGMIANLQSDSKRKLILMPRGTFKSSIGIVGYSIWRLINNPNERIMIDSELYGNSKNFIREIRHKLQASLMTELFGNFIGPQWGEGEITIAQRTLGLKEASITASGLGAEKTGQHYSCVLCDDMNSKNNSATPEACQKIIDHFKMATSILEPDGTMVVIGTRYSSLDLPGWILDNEVNA